MNVNIEGVNAITNNVGDGEVDVIIKESFDDRARIDSNSSLSYIDYDFCRRHNLLVLPLLSGGSRSYVDADDTRISAIGSANLLFTFAEERFVHNFQNFD